MAIRHIAKTIAANTTELLAANASRSYALLQNDSDTAMYIGIGTAAVANTGLRLNANGGSYEMSRATNNLTNLAINALASGGNKVAVGIEIYD